VEGLLLLLLLPHSYNVNNSILLLEDVKQVSVEPRLRMCSFDIDNVCPNIPKWQILDIIINICQNMGILKSISCGINTLVKTIAEQNYFNIIK
jgi:hypothetical protein